MDSQRMAAASDPSILAAEFASAADSMRRGNLSDAGRICQRIVASDARHFGAQYMLGAIALRRGDMQTAERFLLIAIQLNPNVASLHRDRGIALTQLNRGDEALQCFDKALALKPDYFDVFGHRGNTLQQLGRFKDALADYDRAIAAGANSPIVLHNRGTALLRLNRPEEALSSFEKAIALKADYVSAHLRRGEVLRELNRYDDALAAVDRAIAIKPNEIDAFYIRGMTLQDMGRAADAVASYDRAIALKADFAEALNNRGNALKDLERFEEARLSYEQAMAVAPDFADPFYNRGVVLLELNRADEALLSYERAIALKPDYPEAIFSRGLCKLAMGRSEGWEDFEHRWQMKNYPPLQIAVDAPPWKGEALGGRSILVFAEQGLGDTIQFARFLPRLLQSGAAVTFLVDKKLHGILKALPADIRLVSSVQPSERFDYCAPLMSLPHRLGIGLDSVGLTASYIAVDPKRRDKWGQKLGPDGFKVGIAWHGARWHGGAAIIGRSIPLREFYPLVEIKGVRVISLQKNDGIEQLASLPAGM